MTNSNPVQIYCMAKQDRSDRVRWLLEELGVPYQDHFLNKNSGEMNSLEFRKLNPMGRVPVIIDDEKTIFESGAICLYLADKYTTKKLAPALTSDDRATYLQWMFFSVASLECVVAQMFALQGKSDLEVLAVKKHVQSQCEILKLGLNAALEKHTYILPSGFSAADIMLASVIPGAAEYLMTDGSAIAKYMAHMMKRPAAIKAQVFE